ncbi:Uncharacterized protein FWK35_00029642 [Aphis craccivora]|uniref:Uncharacterized protein n=1 Tax=Aphis craccivora TaxID=307492 RepID=A0A6G0VXR5_APHCR|nr:Uncharacterized protein FWK35_00029642 [Aphis craccivora]
MNKAPIGEPREVTLSQEVGGSSVSGDTLDGPTLIGFCDQGVASFEPKCVADRPHNRSPLLPPHNRTLVCDRGGTVQRPLDVQSFGGVPRPRPHTRDSCAPGLPEHAFVLPRQVCANLVDGRLLGYPPLGDFLRMLGRILCNPLVRRGKEFEGTVHRGYIGVLRQYPDATAPSFRGTIQVLSRGLLR